MKCDLCKEKVESTFLDKFNGTYLGRGKKKSVICTPCQKKFSLNEIKTKLGVK